MLWGSRAVGPLGRLPGERGAGGLAQSEELRGVGTRRQPASACEARSVAPPLARRVTGLRRFLVLILS